jgi:hypothetical protein
LTSHHFKPGRFEDLEERDPIDAGRFERDRRDPALDEPVAQGQQVFGERIEGADRTGIGTRRHGHVDFSGADIDPGGVEVVDGRSG